MNSEGPKRRRSLTHVGGAVRKVGERAEAEWLAAALDVPPSAEDGDDAARSHVHGFHTYPARMHPITARRLIDAFLAPGDSVYDPFCGSGTVLVEAMLAGRQAFGTDLNPLAVRLAARKCLPRTSQELERMVFSARQCAEFAEERRKAKAGASRRFPEADVAHFEPHVLLELDSLRSKLFSFSDEGLRWDLSLVLSAILTKLSRRGSDTTEKLAPRRLAAGYASKLFIRKAEEWAARLAAMSEQVTRPHPVQVFVDDALTPKQLPPQTFGGMITSPPYAATYDYALHHALRLRWLKLDHDFEATKEMGSRSAYKRIGPLHAEQAWRDELGRFLTSMNPRLKPGGPLILVMADSAVGSVALRADELIADIARDCGFLPVACVSQDRPHFHLPSQLAFRDRPRAEHAIALRKS